MNVKTISNILIGFSVGMVVGALATKKICDRNFEDRIDAIYNECYRVAKKELLGEDTDMAYSEETSDEKINNNPDNVVPLDIKAHGNITRPYRAYDKPDLSAVHHDKIGDDPSSEMTDAEYFGGDEVDEEQLVESEIADADDLDEDGSDNDSSSRFISEKEFSESYLHFSKTDIFYYRRDQVLADEEDQIITSENDLFGIDVRGDLIRRKLNHGDCIFVRNYHLGTDFQIYVIDGAYQEILFQTPKEREKRITRRKMRGKGD